MTTKRTITIKPRVVKPVPAFYTKNDAASIARVSYQTITRDIKRGLLRVLQPTGKGGDVLVPMGNLAEYIKARNGK